MPSTYSPSLKLELIGNGEQAGTWGTTTNTNLGTLLEQAITGVLPITLTGDVTLTDYNGLSDQARNAVLIFNGLLGAPCNVIAPPSQKVYIIRNRSNATVTIKTTSGNGISIANAGSEVVFCDGTDFYSATAFNYINGNLFVTGNTTTGGSLSVGTTITLGGDMYGNSSKGQWYFPTGNTSIRTSSPINGLMRYNSDLQIYEGYQNSVWVKFTTSPEGNYGGSFLVVAGGGGANNGNTPDNNVGGGGGGGGVTAGGSTIFSSGVTYTAIVGAGGSPGSQGSPSSLTDSTSTVLASCTGGGYGGAPIGGGGGSGGSGGGAATGGSGGSGIAGQGNNGAGGTINAGGGGGGSTAGSSGASGATGGGAGGTGYYSGIAGGAYYAGGGGGAAAGSGGAGGGGQGGNNFGSPGGSGVSGTANTGGGGGGCGGYSNGGGSGGSGVVIISVPTASYTGTYSGSPTITTVGANKVLQFNSGGSYTA